MEDTLFSSVMNSYWNSHLHGISQLAMFDEEGPMENRIYKWVRIRGSLCQETSKWKKWDWNGIEMGVELEKHGIEVEKNGV